MRETRKRKNKAIKKGGNRMIRTLKAKRIEIFDNSKTKYSMSYIKKITGCDDILNGGIFSFGTLKPLCHLKVLRKKKSETITPMDMKMVVMKSCAV